MLFKVHVHDLQSNQVFFFFLIKMLMAVLFFSSFNSSSCISAFLVFCGLGALILGSASSWACALVFLVFVISFRFFLSILCYCLNLMLLYCFIDLVIQVPI